MKSGLGWGGVLNEEGGLVAGQQKSGTGAVEDTRDDTSTPSSGNDSVYLPAPV